jgi:hypothetical protein
MILCLSLMLCTSCDHRVIGRILSSSFTLSYYIHRSEQEYSNKHGFFYCLVFS